DWIYTGSYRDESAPAAQGGASANLAKRRDGIRDPQRNDATGLGLYANWAWSWPLNRRIMYNRASADPTGKPWDPKRPGIQWNGTRWVGDVPDYPPTMDPAAPAACLPAPQGPGGPGRRAAVHHERGGHRPPLLRIDGGWAVPRALRADGVPDPQPAAPGQLGLARRLPLRSGRRPAQPFRPGKGLPIRRNQLPADRARALRHPARPAAGRAAAGGVRRDPLRAGPGAQDQERRPGACEVAARQARGAGAGYQAPRADHRRRAEGLPGGHPHPLGVRRSR